MKLEKIRNLLDGMVQEDIVVTNESLIDNYEKNLKEMEKLVNGLLTSKKVDVKVSKKLRVLAIAMNATVEKLK